MRICVEKGKRMPKLIVVSFFWGRPGGTFGVCGV